MELNKIKKYTKKQVKEFINKPIMITYSWNSASNRISATIKESHYKIKFRKLDSTYLISIRYNQLENIELLDNVERIKDEQI